MLTVGITSRQNPIEAGVALAPGWIPEVIAGAFEAPVFRRAVAAFLSAATDFAAGHAKSVVPEKFEERVRRYVVPVCRNTRVINFFLKSNNNNNNTQEMNNYSVKSFCWSTLVPKSTSCDSSLSLTS